MVDNLDLAHPHHIYGEDAVRRDLLSLIMFLRQLSDDLHDDEGHPRLDRRVVLSSQERSSYIFPSMQTSHALRSQEGQNLLPPSVVHGCGRDAFTDFLARNEVKSLSPFERGTSATVLMGWKNERDGVVIRVPLIENSIPCRHNRMNTPIVVQPIDSIDIGRHGAGVFAEILPYRPVLPNKGIVMREIIPGHDMIQWGEFVVVGADGYRNEVPISGFDSMILTFQTTLDVVGYKLSAPRDIALLPNGTPVFVDPDTIQGSKNSERAFNLLSEHLRVYCYEWPVIEKPVNRNLYATPTYGLTS